MKNTSDLLTGDTIAWQLARDSLGANAGGLFQQTASTPGWGAAPSALIVASKLRGVI